MASYKWMYTQWVLIMKDSTGKTIITRFDNPADAMMFQLQRLKEGWQYIDNMPADEFKRRSQLPLDFS